MTSTFTAWLTGDLDDDASDAFEERLFDDPALAIEATRVLAIVDGLRGLAAQGPPSPVITEAELAALAGRARIVEHRPVDGRIVAEITDEDFVVARILAPADDTRRLEVQFCTPAGDAYFRVVDAPRAGPEILVVCSAHVAREAGTLRVRVVDDRGTIWSEALIENRTA